MRAPVEKDLFCKISGITEDESNEIWETLVKKKRLHKTGRISYIFSRLKDDLDLGLPIKYHHHRKDIIRLLRGYLGVVITPKMFRTSTATILSDEGVEMATVAALCRHKNIQTTHRSYIKKHIKGVKKAIEGKM
jgi:integrase